MTNLKSELFEYQEKAADVSQDMDVLDWRKRHKGDLPGHLVALVQPSSAAAERVFSLLKPVYTTLSMRINANYFRPHLMRITRMRIKPVQAQSTSRGSFNAH